MRLMIRLRVKWRISGRLTFRFDLGGGSGR
jgi:hypothetical protein